VSDQPPQTISREYKGRGGMADFKRDAETMARDNYALVSQVQTPGGRSCAATGFILLGIVLLLVGLLAPPLWILSVICLIIGLASGRSGGQLTVVWRAEQAPNPGTPLPAPSGPETNLLATLDQLASLRDRGAITLEEYEAKKAELLGRL
jgi:hypothetical protein